MSVPQVSPFERVQEAAVATLTARLGTEIGLINTESGADVTVPTPTVVDYFEPVEEGGDGLLVAVIPTGMSVDGGQAPRQYAAGRLLTDVVYDVVGTILRDADWSDQDYMRIVNRVGAAFVRVLLMKYENLELGTSVVLHTRPAGPVRYEVDPDEDPSGRELRRVVVSFVSRVQETL